LFNLVLFISDNDPIEVISRTKIAFVYSVLDNATLDRRGEIQNKKAEGVKSNMKSPDKCAWCGKPIISKEQREKNS
jgi:hypothetical protein